MTAAARRRPRAAVTASAVILLLAAGASGCGLQDDSGRGASLVVSQDFGARPVADLPQPEIPRDLSPLGLLRANVDDVQADAGGRVRAIDGTPGPWALYVNGVGEDAKGPLQKLRDDDAVWWDRHPSVAPSKAQAVVGSFPAPFLHGPDGKKLPVRIECTPAEIPACQTVQTAMTRIGVFAAQGGLQQSITKETLRIIVGPWVRIRDDDAAGQLAGGPQRSGVYVRPSADGRTIAVLSPQGKVARTLGPGDGLIAATRFDDGRPVWVITGPDVAGVTAAAQGFDEGNLKGHLALAVAGGRALPVPFSGR